ncbi:hypothetical protein Patl1_10809 [Pistacia atlantica]|uniref:Uncharacterized protein n=1 Tax=Pistacia atlantica TaxID=434234 RepID=A0ACC1A4X3_9ROSI|nr:hypothetical protein Patl1_10809 [Pistacia atlantica]
MQSNLLANTPSQSNIATSPPQVYLPATSPCHMPSFHVTPIATSPPLPCIMPHHTSNTQIQTDSNSFPPLVSCPTVPKEFINYGLSKDQREKKKNFVKVKLVKNPNRAILCDDNTLCEEGEVIWVARDAIIEEASLDLNRNSPLYDGGKENVVGSNLVKKNQFDMFNDSLALGFEGAETGSGPYEIEVGIGGSSKDINGRANVEDRGIQEGW